MSLLAPCLLALCPVSAVDPAYPQVGQSAVKRKAPVEARLPERATAPLDEPSSAFAGEGGLRLGKLALLEGGKLLLTNGITTVEGASGGGIASWATIGGRQVPGGIGLTGHATAIELPDFGWRSYGAAIGLGDRVELSFARADFDTRDAGALLGLGQGYTFNLETYGAKLRIAGDLVYGETWLSQITLGIEHKRSRDGAVVRALGADESAGTDYTLSATKLLLARSLLISATLRYTAANELGLLGFGSAAGAGHALQFEGSLGHQLSRRAVVGAEYRTKPDNLGLGEDDWMDLFAAFAVSDNVTLTAAYVDLGSIATFTGQRGGFLSAQFAF